VGTAAKCASYEDGLYRKVQRFGAWDDMQLSLEAKTIGSLYGTRRSCRRQGKNAGGKEHKACTANEPASQVEQRHVFSDVVGSHGPSHGVTAGSPAALNGLKEGERLYEIDDKPVSTSMDSEEVAAMLRGPPGTVVRLRVGPPEDNTAQGLPPECFVIKNLIPLVHTDRLARNPKRPRRRSSAGNVFESFRRRASAGDVFECGNLSGKRSSIHVDVTVLSRRNKVFTLVLSLVTSPLSHMILSPGYVRDL
jgi:hypothetical protein